MPSITLRAGLAAALLAAAPAAPALAAPQAPADPPVVFHAVPWVAEKLSFYTPVAGLGVSLLGVTGLPTPLIGVPMMLAGGGVGHAYAGDPWRATLVSLGGVAAPTAAFGTVWGLGNLLIPPVTCSPGGNCDAAPPIAPLTGVAVGVGVAIWYTLWAAADAAETAERRNRERREEARR